MRITSHMIGLIFVLFGFLLLVLGISTLYWPEVSGRLSEATLRQMESGTQWSISPGSSGENAANSSLRWLDAHYSYRVDSEYYEGTLVCVCLAFALPIDELSQFETSRNVSIRYFPVWKSFSVLVAGPDLKLVFLLFALGGGLIYMHRIVEAIISKSLTSPRKLDPDWHNDAIESDPGLHWIANHGDSKRLCAIGSAYTELKRRIGSVNWDNEFHQFFAVTQPGVFMEVGGSLNAEQGLSVKYVDRIKRVEGVIKYPPSNTQELTDIVAAFLKGGENFQNEFDFEFRYY